MTAEREYYDVDEEQFIPTPDDVDYGPTIDSVESETTLQVLDALREQLINGLNVLKFRSEYRNLDLENSLKICRKRLDAYIQSQF